MSDQLSALQVRLFPSELGNLADVHRRRLGSTSSVSISVTLNPTLYVLSSAPTFLSRSGRRAKVVASAIITSSLVIQYWRCGL